MQNAFKLERILELSNCIYIYYFTSFGSRLGYAKYIIQNDYTFALALIIIIQMH